MSWVEEEMRDVELGDKRLDARLLKLLDKLSNFPTLSIPAVSGGWHETKAAYRFFCNKKVTAEKILAPHIEATLSRIAHYPVVLLLQETTTLNFTGQKQREDIGSINHETHLGLLLHPTLAVTPERLCLGIIDTYHWAREKVHHRTPREKSRDHFKAPLEGKESYRKANEIAQKAPKTMVVSVADREADIDDLYHEAQMQSESDSHACWLIRASSNRRLLDGNNRPDSEKLVEKVKRSKPLCEVTFDIPAKEKQIARKITQTIYATQLTLCPPDRKRKLSRKYGDKTVDVTAVIATEYSPPEGQAPLEWVLLTNVPVDNAIRAKEVLQWYLCRWQIEIYFRILKSGCRIEKIQLAEKERFDPCLVLYMIIAWRILYITMIGRKCPDTSCEQVFSTEEWKMAYRVVKKRQPPNKPPPLKEMIKIIACIGGYLNRSNDPDSGPTTLWIGLQRLRDFIITQQAIIESDKKLMGNDVSF